MTNTLASPQRTQNAIYQIIDALAELVSEKVSDNLIKIGFSPIEEIEIKTEMTENQEELLTVKEICEILKVKKGAIYDWRKKKLLKPDTYIGRSPRYKRETITKFINSKK